MPTLRAHGTCGALRSWTAVAHGWGPCYYDHDRQSLELSSAKAHHARVEAICGLGGVLASLPALRCKHPNRGAAYKPR
jgi:hypothetical protein